MKKIEPIIQMSQTECGLCAATMLMDYYDVSLNIHDLARTFPVGRDGSSIADLKKIFKSYSFDTAVYTVREKLSNIVNAALPCIAFMLKGHFVVIEAIDKNQVTILDPAIGRMKIPKGHLDEEFENLVIKITPKDKAFQKINTRGQEFALLKTAILANRLLLFNVAILAVIVYGLVLLVPMLLKSVIDQFLDVERLTEPIGWLSIGILFSGLFYLILNRLKLAIGIKLSIEVDRFLTYQVIDKLFKNKFEYFLKRTSSDIQYRLALLKSLKTVISDSLVQTFLDIGSMIVIFIYILSLQVTYALLLLGIALFVISFSIVIRRRMIMYQNEELANDNQLQIIQYDIFRSIFDVKVLGLSHVKRETWREAYRQALWAHQRNQKFLSLYKNLLSYISLYVPILIPLLGVWLSGLSGSNELGTIVALQTITGTFITGLISISQLSEQVTMIKSYIMRIEDILVQEDEREATKEVDFKGSIRIEDLTFTYPGAKQPVLKNLNLNTRAGETIAIVGESGSGKSTLFYLLLGAYDEYEGHIYYEGVELQGLNKDKLRQQIGVVPQDALLFNGSIRENLIQDATISDEHIYQVLRQVSMADFVKGLPMGLNTVISENGFNLSGGQKQRLALARAIVSKKNVLFLDEATSSLDNITEERIVGYLSGVAQTKVIIAHRLSTIIDSDRIVVLKDGEIAEIGNHAQLLEKKGVYYRMYHKDIKGGPV